jgi:hypothetical protein
VLYDALAEVARVLDRAAGDIIVNREWRTFSILREGSVWHVRAEGSAIDDPWSQICKWTRIDAATLATLSIGKDSLTCWSSGN